MQQRPLGRSGLAVSRLALGTMTWGRDTDADDAAAQLKTFREAGGTLVDTADVYGDGDAEAVIGTLVDALVPRDELVIASKAGLRPGMARRRDGSRSHLLRSLDASLAGWAPTTSTCGTCTGTTRTRPSTRRSPPWTRR